MRRLGRLALALWAAAAAAPAAAQSDAAARGEYLLRAAGGCACHTDVERDGPFLAGGRPLKTPFGVFYSPNITPDPATGIGGWSDADLVRAMRDGVGPGGAHYFPAFPYPAFTGITDTDLRDLKAYLDTVAPVRRENTPHDVPFPFGWRATVGPWKWLFFERGPFEARPDRSETWNRGAYLATALAHCGECHTPRNVLGGLERDMWLAGTEDGPEGELAPNITPDDETGIGDWSENDVAYLLKTGFKPNFDNVQGAMAEAVEHGYKYLTDADRAAIAAYVMSLPPIEHQVGKESAAPASPYE